MPRLGLGSIDLSALGGSGDTVTTIDDFFFESFSAGEMHPMLTTSRTNLIPYSEDFNNAAWVKSSVTFTPNYATAPDGTQTAYRLVSSGGSYPQFYTTLTGLTIGKTYTVSFHVKSDSTTQIEQHAHISGISPSITFTPTNDWVRIEYTRTATANSHAFVIFTNSGSASACSYLIWGYQVEEDGFVSAYIPTSGSTATVSTTLNDTSEVWDFDGTDIMIAEDPEDEGFWEEGSNLVLNHDYADMGSDLVTNGTFETEVTGDQWFNFGSPTTAERSTTRAYEGTHSYHIVGDSTNDGTQAAATQFAGDYSDGDVVEITAYVYPITASSNQIKTGVANSNRSITSSYTVVTGQWNKVQYQVTITDSSTNNNYISFLIAGSAGEFYLDNVSARIVDPNDKWSLGTGWSISDGKARYDASSGSGYTFLGQGGLFPGAGDYEITFTLGDLGGSFAYNYAGVVVNGIVNSFQGFGISSAGTHTIKINNNGSNLNFNIYGNPNSDDFSIDNVTVREYAIQPKDI